MRTRLLVVGLAVPAALTLAACASSAIDGQGSGAGSAVPSASSSGGGTSSTPAPSTSSSNANPAVSLEAQLAQGLSSARTAHLNLQILAAGQLISGSGDEQLSNGKLDSLDLKESVGQSLKLRLIIVNGRTYIKLPSELNHSGKPWQLVRAGSSDPTIRTFAASLSSTQSSASLASVAQLISAARSVKQDGTGTKNGEPTTAYSVDVNPAKLPDKYNGKQALVASGVTSIPVKIVLDSQGRPLRVVENLAVQGQKVNVRITVGSYNKPVSISAPPKGQISTK